MGSDGHFEKEWNVYFKEDIERSISKQGGSESH